MPIPVPEPITEDLSLPHYTASGAPVRLGDRIALHFWTAAFMGIVVISLAAYLANWLL
jgi:hypothetical protein